MRKNKTMRIVFMGTPDYAVPVLNAAVQAGHEIIGVYTQPDKPVGRKQLLTPSPVKVYALEHGLPVYQPRRVKRVAEVAVLQGLQPDLILVAAYGQILSQEILDLPKYGCINLHASLLPRWRGASPIQHAIVSGDTVSGVTAMQMDAGIDTGDMIDKEEVEITDTDTAETLHDKLAEAAGVLTARVLQALAETGSVPHTPQDDSHSTHAPMLSREDGEIDWTRTEKEIYDQVRGLYPWPGTYTYWLDKKLAIWEASKTGEPVGNAVPGEVKTDKKNLYVACKDNWLQIQSLQLQGKKRMDAAAFLLGNHPEGDILHVVERT